MTRNRIITHASRTLAFVGFIGAFGLAAKAGPPADDIPPAERRGEVGAKPRELVLGGLEGQSLCLPDRPRVDTALTVVVFWATWNEPGMKELKRLEELWPSWSAHGVRVVGVNVETHRFEPADRQVVRDCLAQHPLPFPNVIDPGLVAFSEYGVVAVPTTVVMDASGTIVFRLPGYPKRGAENLVEYVEGAVIRSAIEARGEVPEKSNESKRAIRYTRLGRQLIAKGQGELAEYTLRKAVLLDPQLVDPRLELALLYESSGRGAQAERVLREAEKDHPGDARPMLARAELKLRAGDSAGAVTLAREVLEQCPSLAGALLVLAGAERAAGDLSGALAHLDRAALANPFSVDVMIASGEVHEAMGAKQKALEWYERAYSLLDPTWNTP